MTHFYIMVYFLSICRYFRFYIPNFIATDYLYTHKLRKAHYIKPYIFPYIHIHHQSCFIPLILTKFGLNYASSFRWYLLWLYLIDSIFALKIWLNFGHLKIEVFSFPPLSTLIKMIVFGPNQQTFSKSKIIKCIISNDWNF